jgi:hypothetical protein
MSYTVTAPLVLAVDPDGHTHHVYQGGVIQWLSDAQREHFLAEKLVEETDDAAVEPGGEKPGPNATNKVLVAWLVANVAKDDGSDYTEAELKPLNKAQLREIVDSVE